ncbi:MAG TPA: DUF3175 domain-containing protein [Candidatus Binataceae bacterium]|nr:DUF3175 domain-containing protein [Candidatus Binataceae bacterium]
MPKRKLWVRKVQTESTFPPAGVFKKDAKTIARVMATRRTSPKGIGSAIRMIQYFINRGGKILSTSRKKTLEQAKRILQRKRANSRSTASRSKRSKRASSKRTG